MPFRETCAMEERIRMLAERDTGAFTVSTLAARYGVSRETFYVWLQRRASGEARWFENRSHARWSCPQKTEADVVAAIVAMRERFAHFGPKKIRARLMRDSADLMWPGHLTASLDRVSRAVARC